MPSLMLDTQASGKATHAAYHYINSAFSGTDGSVFALYDNVVNFYEAKQICEDLGGHLATIMSDEEEAAVIDMINAVSTTRSGFFIGVHDPNSNGEFEYIDGKKLSEYENGKSSPPWGTGEPNNLTQETAVEVYMSTKKWNNDSVNAQNRGFICEFEKKVLVFNANEGYFGSDNNSIEITKELHYDESLKITTPIRTGYSFQGWYDDRTNGLQYSFYSGDYKNVASGTYYAHWKGNEYTVKFNQRGVKNTTELSSIKVTYGSTYPTLPTPEPKDTSKEFVCWTDLDGNEISTSSIVNKTADHSLYPRWKDKATVTIKNITVNTLPEKIDYLVGEKFDPSGLTLTTVFNDLSEAIIGYENCSFDITDIVLSGRQTVKVAYQGVETEFVINAYQIDSVSVRTLPMKTVYEIGESLDLTGLSLLLQYDNAAEESVYSGFHVKNVNQTFAKPGKYYITVSYKGFDTQFEVYVNRARFESVEITTADGYAVYQNESLDYSKIVLCVTLTDGTRLYLNPQEAITDISFDSSVIGTKTANVLFAYEGELHTADLTVDVVEKPEAIVPARIYSDSAIDCTASDLIRVPIYVDCETPLSGIGVKMEFDSEKLIPCFVEYDPGFASLASVVDSLNGNVSDHVRIVALTDYQIGDSFSYSGRICSVYFKAIENKSVETEILISIIGKDTFNSDNKSVPFISSTVSISIEQVAEYQNEHINSIYALDQVQGSDSQLLNVPVYVNSSNLSGCIMTVIYDNHLIQPVEIEKSVLLENFTFEYNIKHNEGKIIIAFFGSDKIVAAGVLLNISFNIENLNSGHTNIVIDVNEAVNDVNKNVSLTGCGSTIYKACSGDADEDGSVTLQDVVVITRWLAGGWNVTINEVNSDVNRDGVVDLKDAVLIRRFLAGGWNVVLR